MPCERLYRWTRSRSQCAAGEREGVQSMQTQPLLSPLLTRALRSETTGRLALAMWCCNALLLVLVIGVSATIMLLLQVFVTLGVGVASSLVSAASGVVPPPSHPLIQRPPARDSRHAARDFTTGSNCLRMPGDKIMRWARC